ncbi:5-oxoprolinase subunit C family protein [Oceanobacillus sp. CAU 1775]
MELSIIKPGLLTTVQDLGREAFRKHGVSASGVMDPLSFRLANILVGNDENTAALEVTLVGPTIRFEQETAFALAGGNLSPFLNNESIDMWSVIHVKPGDELSFGKYYYGARVYIAFAGGIDVPKVMGSRATFMRGAYGGLEGRALKRGDIIRLEKPPILLEAIRGRKLRYQDIPDFKTERPVRFILGPHVNEFEKESIEKFLSEPYIVSNASDRMGYRLEGETLKHKNAADIISDFIAVGTIQVPGNGQPIIHMADCGTSGGYTKLGVIISEDIPYIAQKKPGDKLYFEPISIQIAQEKIVEREKLLREINLNNKILKL